MIVAARASERDAGFVRLAATVPLRMDPVAVAAMLERGPEGWELRSSNGGIRRFAVDLRLRLGGEATGLTTFGKAAWVDLGTVRRVGDGYVVPIEWQASSAAPLFPVFSGELRVEDTGPGLGDDEREHAFERFYLHERYGRERPVGTGLGLAIVKELIEAMGGSVRVESTPGRETVFTVSLRPARLASRV